ncbi:MAG TPA: SHOCT domain-containing protein [Candidatus Limnocylindrales bacterium]|nr:SHOCT domain-containing protein [Candidatus Limnocylindrales bacterium]
MDITFEPLFLVGMLFTMLVPVLLVLAIAWPLWHLARGTFRPHAPSDPALDELRVRYARGEIGREEFEERLRVLTDRR